MAWNPLSYTLVMYMCMCMCRLEQGVDVTTCGDSLYQDFMFMTCALYLQTVHIHCTVCHVTCRLYMCMSHDLQAVCHMPCTIAGRWWNVLAVWRHQRSKVKKGKFRSLGTATKSTNNTSVWAHSAGRRGCEGWGRRGWGQDEVRAGGVRWGDGRRVGEGRRGWDEVRWGDGKRGGTCKRRDH